MTNEPVLDQPAWPPTRAEMRDYLRRLRMRQDSWLKAANRELAKRLNGAPVVMAAPQPERAQWVAPPVPELVAPPQFTRPQQSARWVQ